MEKPENMGEDHCVRMRKQLREQRVQRVQGKVPHYTSETDEPRLGGKRVWVGQPEQGAR